MTELSKGRDPILDDSSIEAQPEPLVPACVQPTAPSELLVEAPLLTPFASASPVFSAPPPFVPMFEETPPLLNAGVADTPISATLVDEDRANPPPGYREPTIFSPTPPPTSSLDIPVFQYQDTRAYLGGHQLSPAHSRDTLVVMAPPISPSSLQSSESFDESAGEDPIPDMSSSAQQLAATNTNTNKLASGIAGAVLTNFVLGGGVVLGALGGFGVAYGTQCEGATGDVCRAMGDVALYARQRAVELDAKHALVAKGQVAAIATWRKLLVLNREHRLIERFKAFVYWSWKESIQFAKQNKVLEKSAQGVGVGFGWLVLTLREDRRKGEETEAAQRQAQRGKTQKTTSFSWFSKCDSSSPTISARTY